MHASFITSVLCHICRHVFLESKCSSSFYSLHPCMCIRSCYRIDQVIYSRYDVFWKPPNHRNSEVSFHNLSKNIISVNHLTLKMLVIIKAIYWVYATVLVCEKKNWYICWVFIVLLIDAFINSLFRWKFNNNILCIMSFWMNKSVLYIFVFQFYMALFSWRQKKHLSLYIHFFKMLVVWLSLCRHRCCAFVHQSFCNLPILP